MKKPKSKDAFVKELEAVLRECQADINDAIRDYQEEIQSAMNDLKKDLTATKRF